jgi:hypothetical protein
MSDDSYFPILFIFFHYIKLNYDTIIASFYLYCKQLIKNLKLSLKAKINKELCFEKLIGKCESLLNI